MKLALGALTSGANMQSYTTENYSQEKSVLKKKKVHNWKKA